MRTVQESGIPLTPELAMARVRRRINPRQFQAYYLYFEQGWPLGEVARFLNVTEIQVHLAGLWVSLAFWWEMARSSRWAEAFLEIEVKTGPPPKNSPMPQDMGDKRRRSPQSYCR
jgi:hypothetical protein